MAAKATYSRKKRTADQVFISLFAEKLYERKQAKVQKKSQRKRGLELKDLPPVDQNHKLLDDSFEPVVRKAPEHNDPFDKLFNSEEKPSNKPTTRFLQEPKDNIIKIRGAPKHNDSFDKLFNTEEKPPNKPTTRFLQEPKDNIIKTLPVINTSYTRSNSSKRAHTSIHETSQSDICNHSETEVTNIIDDGQNKSAVLNTKISKVLTKTEVVKVTNLHNDKMLQDSIQKVFNWSLQPPDFGDKRQNDEESDSDIFSTGDDNDECCFSVEDIKSEDAVEDISDDGKAGNCSTNGIVNDEVYFSDGSDKLVMDINEKEVQKAAPIEIDDDTDSAEVAFDVGDDSDSSDNSFLVEEPQCSHENLEKENQKKQTVSILRNELIQERTCMERDTANSFIDIENFERVMRENAVLTSTPAAKRNINQQQYPNIFSFELSRTDEGSRRPQNNLMNPNVEDSLVRPNKVIKVCGMQNSYLLTFPNGTEVLARTEPTVAQLNDQLNHRVLNLVSTGDPSDYENRQTIKEAMGIQPNSSVYSEKRPPMVEKTHSKATNFIASNAVDIGNANSLHSSNLNSDPDMFGSSTCAKDYGGLRWMVDGKFVQHRTFIMNLDTEMDNPKGKRRKKYKKRKPKTPQPNLQRTETGNDLKSGIADLNNAGDSKIPDKSRKLKKSKKNRSKSKKRNSQNAETVSNANNLKDSEDNLIKSSFSKMSRTSIFKDDFSAVDDELVQLKKVVLDIDKEITYYEPIIKLCKTKKEAARTAKSILQNEEDPSNANVNNLESSFITLNKDSDSDANEGHSRPLTPNSAREKREKQPGQNVMVINSEDGLRSCKIDVSEERDLDLFGHSVLVNDFNELDDALFRNRKVTMNMDSEMTSPKARKQTDNKTKPKRAKHILQTAENARNGSNYISCTVNLNRCDSETSDSDDQFVQNRNISPVSTNHGRKRPLKPISAREKRDNEKNIFQNVVVDSNEDDLKSCKTDLSEKSDWEMLTSHKPTKKVAKKEIPKSSNHNLQNAEDISNVNNVKSSFNGLYKDSVREAKFVRRRNVKPIGPDKPNHRRKRLPTLDQPKPKTVKKSENVVDVRNDTGLKSLKTELKGDSDLEMFEPAPVVLRNYNVLGFEVSQVQLHTLIRKRQLIKGKHGTRLNEIDSNFIIFKECSVRVKRIGLETILQKIELQNQRYLNLNSNAEPMETDARDIEQLVDKKVIAVTEIPQNHITIRRKYHDISREHNYSISEVAGEQFHNNEPTSNTSGKSNASIQQVDKILEAHVIAASRKKKDTSVVPSSEQESSGRIRLESGKKWRRSILNYKRRSVRDKLMVTKPEILEEGEEQEKYNDPRNTSLAAFKEISLVISVGESISILEGHTDWNLRVEDKKTKSALRRVSIFESLTTNLFSEKFIPANPPDSSWHEKAEQILLKICQQTRINATRMIKGEYKTKISKIGEGVFGEVYMKTKGFERSVVKVMPIEGETLVNGERQKKIDEILTEFLTAHQLTQLRRKEIEDTDTFCDVIKFGYYEGPYPKIWLSAWDKYDAEKKSENDRPDFPDTQKYVSIEMRHGGQDLESYVFANYKQVFLVFLQVALALSVAERAVEFEHRDLHWGNILVKAVNPSTTCAYRAHRKFYAFESDVKATIIDYTLSRISFRGFVFFNDLSKDPTLFSAEGDYQFEIYRKMREINNDNWRNFTPKTNVFWLHYLLVKMISDVHVENKTVHRNYFSTLNRLKKIMTHFDSTNSFVSRFGDMFMLDLRTIDKQK